MNASIRSLIGAAIAIVVMAGVLVAAAGLWFQHEVYGRSSLPTHERTVIVPKGATGSDVAALLAQDGVIGNPLVFRVLARLRHVEGDFKAGEYTFAPGQSLDAVLRKMVSGTQQVARWVTIPEGYTSREIAATLSNHEFGGAAPLERTFMHERMRFAHATSANLEGYLFPSTYLVPVSASPEAIAKIMTDEFRKQLPPDAEARAKRLGMTIPQVVTIASLVEREAKADDERALMAGVYYNRLRRGMPLEVDATIEYIFPEHKTEITKADLRIDSPYNTYRHPGLPPTPIANPGRPSLLAAFNPQPSDYLYYVAKPDGRSAFARTLDEHNANVNRYLR